MPDRSRLKPVLVNRYEKATDRLLTTAAQDHGDRLLTKVRLADVVDVDAVGIRPDAKSYGLKAHLDFVMVDANSSVPRFAVELDVAQHWTDPKVRRRDRLKDEICEWGRLPLLRITSDFTKGSGRWQVLTYVVNAFYLSEAFFDAQDSGYILADEPFMITSILDHDNSGNMMFNALDQEARRKLRSAYEAGRVPVFMPDEFHTADRDRGVVESHAFMAVAPDRYLIARFRFQGISPSELASQLAVAQLGELVERWLNGQRVDCDGRRLVANMHDVQRAIDRGGFLGSMSGGALRAGGPLPDGASIRIHLGRSAGDVR